MTGQPRLAARQARAAPADPRQEPVALVAASAGSAIPEPSPAPPTGRTQPPGPRCRTPALRRNPRRRRLPAVTEGLAAPGVRRSPPPRNLARRSTGPASRATVRRRGPRLPATARPPGLRPAIARPRGPRPPVIARPPAVPVAVAAAAGPLAVAARAAAATRPVAGRIAGNQFPQRKASAVSSQLARSRSAGPGRFFVCAEPVRQLGGESPLYNLMEVK